uniref:Uncharacterized protein n=1 Tax=Glossina palpalis gambiensis TaxID=67801 RepID=A0A1B0BEK6_9MUSC
MLANASKIAGTWRNAQPIETRRDSPIFESYATMRTSTTVGEIPAIQLRLTVQKAIHAVDITLYDVRNVIISKSQDSKTQHLYTYH